MAAGLDWDASLVWVNERDAQGELRRARYPGLGVAPRSRSSRW
jgi:hypothetical protein